MFYLDCTTGKRYKLGEQFTYNSTTYTSAGATHERFIALGFHQVYVDPAPSAQFYNYTGPNDDGSWTSTAKDLATLKVAVKRRMKVLEHSILQETDWYIIRSIERNIAVPQVITTYRDAVRAAATNYFAAIDASTTVGELQTLDLSSVPDWPEPLSETYDY